MSWERYYNRHDIRPFSAQIPAYELAFNHLVTDYSHPRTFLTAGLHPQNNPPDIFERFTNYLYPHPDNLHLTMDQNLTPLKAQTDGLTHPIQSRFQSLPFCPNSIDYLFLDFVIDFMPSNQIDAFSQGLRKVLTPDGLAFISFSEPTFFLTDQLIPLLFDGTKRYYYTANQICSLFGALQLSLLAATQHGQLAVFSLPTSTHPLHTGPPFAFYEDAWSQHPHPPRFHLL